MKIYHEIPSISIKDETILHYTGYMFGIGASAFSEKAIAKISDLKHREMQKGFITLFGSLNELRSWNFAELEDKKTYYQMNNIWPANLTVLMTPLNDRLKHLTLTVRSQ